MRRHLFIPLACLGLVPALNAKPDDAAIERGKAVYQSCIACHGPDGKGVKAGTLEMAPTLHGSYYLKSEKGYKALTALLLKGILKEDQKYVQAMLSLEAALDDQQIADLIAYVTSEFGGVPQAASAKTVAAHRASLKNVTSPYKRRNLTEMQMAENAPKLLSNTSYKLYRGKFEELPNFSQLTPIREGKFANDIISLKPFESFKEPFGLVVEADLTIPRDGSFRFRLTSDDGSALAINGETVVGNDGIHAEKTATLSEDLSEGHHTLKLLYFDAGGNRKLALGVNGPGLAGSIPIYLTDAKPAGKKEKSSNYDPIVLKPASPDAAMVQRTYFSDAGKNLPRAFAIALPGDQSVIWSAETLNVEALGKGGYLDASPHWNGRGSASKWIAEKKTGIFGGMALQTLATLDASWNELPTDSIAFAKDEPEPKEILTYSHLHPDFQFLGYSVDAKDFPTFRYEYKGSVITDSFGVAGDLKSPHIRRTVTFEKALPEDTFFRVSSEPVTPKEQANTFGTKSAITLVVEGGEVSNRPAGDALARIDGSQPLIIDYIWK